MEHVVFFPDADGAPAFRRVAGLDEAVRLVEHLRNVEGTSSVSVHALTEVPLAFRAWYKVELPGEQPVAQLPAVPEQALAPALTLVEAPAEAAAEPVAADDAPPVEPAARDDEHDASPVGVGAQAGPAGLGFFA